MNSKFAAVVMAAGKSTRMKSAIPKAAHNLCGKPVTSHVIDACIAAGIKDIIVVVGYEAELVVNTLGDSYKYAYQLKQLGTGHACMQAMPEIPEDITGVVVLPGDAPLIRPETLVSLIDTHINNQNSATLLTAVLDDAASYGRIIRDETGKVLKIQEAKDSSPEELNIKEINTSIYCFDKEHLIKNLALINTDNAQKEYYLTDVIELASKAGNRVGAVAAEDSAETFGINNRIELAEAASILRKRILDFHMLNGVSIIDPLTTYIDCDVIIGKDTIIYPCTFIESKSRIGNNCKIGPFARLTDSFISDGAEYR